MASQSRKRKSRGRPAPTHCDVCGLDGIPVQVGQGNRYKRHPECRGEHRRRSQRAAYKENPDSFKLKTRALSMGITPTRLDEMYEQANRSCEMCGTSEADIPGAYKTLAIDHDHRCCAGKRDGRLSRRACGKCVRGLLCPRCNKLLTLTDEVTLAAIEAYLSRFQ